MVAERWATLLDTQQGKDFVTYIYSSKHFIGFHIGYDYSRGVKKASDVAIQVVVSTQVHLLLP